MRPSTQGRASASSRTGRTTSTWGRAGMAGTVRSPTLTALETSRAPTVSPAGDLVRSVRAPRRPRAAVAVPAGALPPDRSAGPARGRADPRRPRPRLGDPRGGGLGGVTAGRTAHGPVAVAGRAGARAGLPHRPGRRDRRPGGRHATRGPASGAGGRHRRGGRGVDGGPRGRRRLGPGD